MALPLRTRLRRFRMAAQTALGWGARGFFTPYRYAAGAKPATGYPEIEAVFAKRDGEFRSVLTQIEGFAGDLSRIGSNPPPSPRWDQGWFAPLDAAVAYTMVRSMPPKTIIEVGSGHSTRFLARALKDAGLDATHVSIDPAPRAALLDLPVNWESALLSEAHLPLFDTLKAGDIAFFDSSHILLPGLDVDLILNRILPRLKPGVRVHIHDVFLPDPYPAAWDWRGYTEQNGLGGWLMGGAYEPLFASAYAVSRLDALAMPVFKTLPRHPEAIESSLWMVKT